MTKTNKEEFNRQTQTNTEVEAAPSYNLGIDYDYFQQFIDDPGVSEKEKRDLIEIVWSIVCSAIDLRWNVHPLQQATVEKEDPSLLQDDLTSALKQIALQDD